MRYSFLDGEARICTHHPAAPRYAGSWHRSGNDLWLGNRHGRTAERAANGAAATVRNAAERTDVVAPGVNYSRGSGWEVGIEAQIPTNRATGTGWGVIARVVIQFDYLMPDSILGRPLFPAR